MITQMKVHVCGNAYMCGVALYVCGSVHDVAMRRDVYAHCLDAIWTLPGLLWVCCCLMWENIVSVCCARACQRKSPGLLCLSVLCGAWERACCSVMCAEEGAVLWPAHQFISSYLCGGARSDSSFGMLPC